MNIKPGKKESALIDTGVILSDPDIVNRAEDIGYPLITNTVLGELEIYNRSFHFRVSANFKNTLQIIIQQKPIPLDAFPCGKSLIKGDKLYQYKFNNSPLFILNRNKVGIDSSAIIREVAKDYDLILLTIDTRMKAFAEVEGIRAIFYEPKSNKNRNNKKDTRTVAKLPPFKKANSVTKIKGIVKIPLKFPNQGDSVQIKNGKSVKLGKKIGKGGEGQIFEVKGKAG